MKNDGSVDKITWYTNYTKAKKLIW